MAQSILINFEWNLIRYDEFKGVRFYEINNYNDNFIDILVQICNNNG